MGNASGNTNRADITRTPAAVECCNLNPSTQIIEPLVPLNQTPYYLANDLGTDITTRRNSAGQIYNSYRDC